MPTYIIKAPNGKQLEVTGEKPPTEGELDAIFKAAGVGPDAPEAPARGGITRPLTSVVQPELEAMRGTLNAATAERPGDTQPVMARSRTGTLYPSGINTGGVGAIARGVASGAGNAAITQAEGATSPLGIVAAAIPAAKAGYDKIVTAIEGAPSVQRAVQIIKAMATDPDAIGIIAPRASNGMKVAQKFGSVYTKAKESVDATASGAPETAAAGGTPAPPGPPSPAASASAMSPQRVMNELAIQARRQGVQLSAQDYEVAKQAVGQGVSPTEAVAALKQTAQQTPAGSMSQAYTQLRSAGKTHDQAMTEIRTQEKLAKTLKTPSSEEVVKRVQYRNEHGRWPTDE